MSNDTKSLGDSQNFDNNWKTRQESLYNHWCEGEPKNQIQFAFRQHWNLFKKIMDENGIKGGKSLEVGCGRASISSYFAQNNFKATCLDLSAQVIEVAKKIYAANGQSAEFIVGDALALPFKDESYDVVVSIGLLEHFEDVSKVLEEQARILRKGGLFLGYIVPENPTNLQKDFNWINDILKENAKLSAQTETPKYDIYRSDYTSEVYIAEMKKLPFANIKASGVYPVPMLSPSISFPFTLNSPEVEKILVNHFTDVLSERAKTGLYHPWLCEESYGQAFLVWAIKE